MYDTKKRNSMAKHNNTGKWGEDLAADYLREKGYEIIERDWRDGHRDIDNIGMAANTYVKMLNVLDELRFDVVSVIGGTKETAQVEHIVDAFNPCMAF